LITIKFTKELMTSAGKRDLQIDIQINEGELSALYGESGSGKTTILRVLAGLDRVKDGFIQVGEKVWLDTSKGINIKPQKRRIGFVFQEPNLFPHLTAKQNIAFAATSVKADEMIRLIGMEKLQNSKPEQLSGGQRQRIALARAVASDPEILLLDEPFSSLDVNMRTDLQEAILHIHQQFGITTILVSHDMPEVFRLAQRVYVIADGHITHEGSAADVFGSQKGLSLIGTVVEIKGAQTTVLCGNELITISSRQLKLGERVSLKVDIQSLKLSPTVDPLDRGE